MTDKRTPFSKDLTGQEYVSQKQDKQTYHHGDLRISLVDAASKMIKEGGINSLSLRKLAEIVGVSRTALYHHFKNKNDLLCAIAEQGFEHWQKNQLEVLEKSQLNLKEKYRELFRNYITLAAENPEMYDLMFGRAIWKQNTATKNLKDVAYLNFQHQLQITKQWQQHGLLSPEEDSLRLAQVIWATMHGIARLITDGIYSDTSNIDELCNCAANLFTKP